MGDLIAIFLLQLVYIILLMLVLLKMVMSLLGMMLLNVLALLGRDRKTCRCVIGRTEVDSVEVFAGMACRLADPSSRVLGTQRLRVVRVRLGA